MKAIALYNFDAAEKNELSVKKNDILDILEEHGGWWKVQNIYGKSGLVPVDYIAAPVTEGMKVLSRGKTKEVHKATSEEELSVENSCQVAILDHSDDYWWLVGFSGKAGYIPKHKIRLFKKQEKKGLAKGGSKLLTVVPDKAQCDENATVLFSFQETLPESGQFIVVFKGDHCEKAVDAEKINAFTLKATTPEYYPPERTQIIVNHHKTGKSTDVIAKDIKFMFESRLDVIHRTLVTESDPINFLCSSFQIEHGDVQNVDHILSGFLEKRIPEGFNVLKSEKSVVKQHEALTKETPTLLHFASYYNLKKLARTLLKCPGAKEALRVKNCHGMVPSGIAEFRKHNELEKLLQDHQVGHDSDQDYEGLIYTSMEDCYQVYTSMDGTGGKHVEPMTNKRPTSSFDEEPEIYEDMEGRNGSEEHYDIPRPEGDSFDTYDEVEGKRHEETLKKIDEYKVFGRMTEKEVQLALIMKRVKERYITQDQALEMAKVLRLEPKVDRPPVARKPKILKKMSAPVMSELTNKVNSLQRTSSTSSRSSVSSVSSGGSVASSGYTSEETLRPKFGATDGLGGKAFPRTPGLPQKPVKSPAPAPRRDRPLPKGPPRVPCNRPRS